MFLREILITLLVLTAKGLCTNADVNANEDYYVAGTVEYNPLKSAGTVKESVELNLKEYLKLIELANRKNVDILVFPEATLNYQAQDRKSLLDEAVSVPDAERRVAPCDHPRDYSNVLVSLSKAAKDNSIYVLVNLVEKVPCRVDPKICRLPYNAHTDGFSLYNTNIVFDRYGRVISKYRKINLFIEPAMDEPLSQAPSVFDTDFNVKFGHFICFDIMFKDPARLLIENENVTNILYPVFWFSGLPFFSATAMHQAWAMVNNVNLIAAGGNNPISGTSGTGIYIGRKGFETMIMCPSPVRKLYTAKVPKNNAVSTQIPAGVASEKECSGNMLELNLSEAWADEGPVVFPISTPQTICVNGDKICCSFDIKKKERPVPPGALSYKYALTVNYTRKLYARKRNLGELTCAIITCTGTIPKTCGRRFKSNNVFQATEFEHVKIHAKVRSDSFKDVMVMPITTTTGISPFDIATYSFTSGDLYKDKGYAHKDFVIESKRNIPDFLIFGIFGRDFRLDDSNTAVS